MSAESEPQLGKLKPPYPMKRCAISTCGVTLTDSAFLFRDLGGGHLCVLCGDCAIDAELNRREQLILVAL